MLLAWLGDALCISDRISSMWFIAPRGWAELGLVTSTLWSTAVCHCERVSRLCLEKKKSIHFNSGENCLWRIKCPYCRRYHILTWKTTIWDQVEPSQKSLLTGTQIKKHEKKEPSQEALTVGADGELFFSSLSLAKTAIHSSSKAVTDLGWYSGLGSFPVYNSENFHSFILSSWRSTLKGTLTFHISLPAVDQR